MSYKIVKIKFVYKVTHVTPSTISSLRRQSTQCSRPTDQLPDPWLFDSEALLRELDRCRETVLHIPITNPNATHCGIQLAVSAIWNLTENLRYLLYLHREQQRAIRKQHDQSLSAALSKNNATQKIVHLGQSHAPAPVKRTLARSQISRSRKNAPGVA